MFSKVLVKSTATVSMALTRNMGSSAVLMNKNDPIQQLFLDKIREYNKKKSAAKGGLVDQSPEAQKAVKDEIEKINKAYGSSATGEFPQLNFADPKLELNQEKLESIKL